MSDSDASGESPIQVAIIGGGCAGMAAAFELSRPELAHRYAVTVYQMGWRLGGKGASGRGEAMRIEEHGLHLWMGYYENAFRLIRECYAELGRDPRRTRIATWTDAFSPANFNAVADWSPAGQWLRWPVEFPAAPGLPGDPDPKAWSVLDYLSRAAGLLRALLQTLVEGTAAGDTAAPESSAAGSTAAPGAQASARAAGMTTGDLAATLARLTRYGAVVGLGALVEGVHVLEAVLARLPAYPQSMVAQLIELVSSSLSAQLEALALRSDDARRLWEVADLLLAALRGSIRFRLAFDPRGFDAIDDYDSREWLKLNGASPRALNGAFIRALYDLAFAYEGGDPDRPRIAAGSALRGAFRAFFTYRGAFFWRMSAGMGDVIFAPLYEVLRARGVRFEFFHKLRNVGLSSGGLDAPHVATLQLDVQATLAGGGEYRPLVDVDGLPSWPSEPDHRQLIEGARIREEAWDLESQWDSRRAGDKTLRVGVDFDLVVLAVGVGALPHTCRELIRAEPRWSEMVARVRSVPTQAFQLWLGKPMRELGWGSHPVNLSGFVEPFDTWADMSHVATHEGGEPAAAIAYFCSVLRETPSDQALQARLFADASAGADVTEAAARYVEQRYEEVRANAVTFLERDVRWIWPGAHTSEGFRWELLQRAGAPLRGPALFLDQYWNANVRPSDRYTQALPGSTRHRISPLDRTFDNLTLAGDWTSCSLNMGCVEAAVLSGLLAAHAIAGVPSLGDIVGYDHP